MKKSDYLIAAIIQTANTARTDETIRPLLEPEGYSSRKYDDAIALGEALRGAEEQIAHQKGVKKQTTASLHESKADFDRTFRKQFLVAARHLFAEDSVARSALGFDRTYDSGYAGWLEQRHHFIDGLFTASEEDETLTPYLTALGRYGIEAVDVDALRSSLANVEALKHQQMDAARVLSGLYRKRDVLLKDVRRWLAIFFSIFRRTLPERPDLLLHSGYENWLMAQGRHPLQETLAARRKAEEAARSQQEQEVQARQKMLDAERAASAARLDAAEALQRAEEKDDEATALRE